MRRHPHTGKSHSDGEKCLPRPEGGGQEAAAGWGHQEAGGGAALVLAAEKRSNAHRDKKRVPAGVP